MDVISLLSNMDMAQNCPFHTKWTGIVQQHKMDFSELRLVQYGPMKIRD